MPQVFNSRTVKSMDETTRERIVSSGFPISVYETGQFPLGPINKSSVARFAIYNTILTEHQLPLPPSQYFEMVVDRCTGKMDKQDWREIIDGQPGYGKSTSAISGCGRYAIEAADRYGQDPKDYFTIDNCALLQDTDGVTHLMDELDKEQAVLIDDAGVSAGSHDFQSSSNKNLAAIMSTCRTKRWYVCFTAPMNKHLDLQIRELVYAKSKVFKPCHAAGFNIMKRKGINLQVNGSKVTEFNPHFIFDETKVDLYASFSPDYLDPYKGIVAEYEEARDLAADSLIHERACRESDKKCNVTKRDKKFNTILTEHKTTIYNLTHDDHGHWLQRRGVGFSKDEGTFSIRKISSETGLTPNMIDRVIAQIKKENI